MRPTIDLTKLHRAVHNRLRKLRRAHAGISSMVSAHERSSMSSFCVMELDNLIINTHREFLVSTLHNKCWTTAGTRVSHALNFATVSDVWLFVMRQLEPQKFASRFRAATVVDRRDETKIRDPRKLLQIANLASLSNRSQISTALSLNSTAFDEIGVYRNFFAHRNIETGLRVKRFSVGLGLMPVSSEWELISQLVPRRPITLFESWVDDVEIFSEYLLE